MKHFICSLIVLFLPLTAFGQDGLHEEGDKSLNFSFDGFNVEEYKYGIGGKYWTSNTIALTGSFDFGESDTGNVSGGTTTTKYDSQYYGLSFGMEKHFSPRKSISPYYGFEFSYGRSKSTDEIFGATYETKSTTYRLSALFGVEYQINEEISLAAEYWFGYYYSDSKSSSTLSNSESTNKGFEVGTASLVLLFYF